jgi:transposase-like protein
MTLEQIEKSKVIALYMGRNTKVLNSKLYFQNHLHLTGTMYHISWDALHEVWEVISGEIMDGIQSFIMNCEKSMIGNDIDEAFDTFYNTIIFINQIKSMNND